MEREKLLKPSELLIIVVILISLILIIGGAYLYFLEIKEKLGSVAITRESPRPMIEQQGKTDVWPKHPSDSPDATADWELYRNERRGFELKYPPDWEFIVDNAGDTLRLYSTTSENMKVDEENDSNLNYAVVVINVTNLGGDEKLCLSSEQTVTERLFCRLKQFARKEEIKEITINGLRAAHYNYAFFEILLANDLSMRIDFIRPTDPGMTYSFDSLFFDMISTIKKLN